MKPIFKLITALVFTAVFTSVQVSFYPRSVLQTSCLSPKLSAEENIFVEGVGDVLSCFDLSEVSADKKAELARLMLRFKFGDSLAVHELSTAICDLIRPLLSFDKRYAFMFRFGTLPHSTFYMSERVVRQLAREGFDCFVSPIRQKSWPPAYTSVLSKQERFNIIENTMAVEQDLAGVCAVVMDDVIASGGYMREMMRSVRAAGASEVLSAVYVKGVGKKHIDFELLAFEHGEENLETEVFDILDQMQGRVSQSGLKYLLRMAALDEERMFGVLSDLSLSARMELFVRSVAYFADVPEGKAEVMVPFLRVLSKAINPHESFECFIPVLGISVDFPIFVESGSRNYFAVSFRDSDTQTKTLHTDSRCWPNIETLFAFAKAVNYGYVVFTDRRTMAPEQMQHALDVAYSMEISLCSPYFTTLERHEYAPLDALGHELQSIVNSDEKLEVFRSSLEMNREFAKRQITKSVYSSRVIVQVAFKYNRFVRSLFTDIGKYCLQSVDTEGKYSDDIAVFLTGSTASNTATIASDIEFEIVCRDDAVADWATEYFAPVFTSMLRTVGFDLGPDDALQKKHWENRYELKTMEGSARLFHPNMDPSTYLMACTKAFNTAFAFGDAVLAYGWSDIVAAEASLALRYTDLLESLEENVDSFVKISRNGRGVFSKRNMIVACNEVTGHVFSIQMLILRAFQLAMNEVVLRRVSLMDSGAHPWKIPSNPLELLHRAWSAGWFKNLSSEEYSKTYEALFRLLAARQKKAALNGNIYAGVPVSDLYEGLFDDVDTLVNFIDRFILSQRSAVKTEALDAINQAA